MNDSLHGFEFNTCERKALVNPIPSLSSVTSPETGGIASGWLNLSARLSLSTKCRLTGIGCCILALAASLQKATEVNTTKLVVMKNNVEPGKTKKNRKFRGQKTAEKGGKTAENGGKTAEKDGL